MGKICVFAGTKDGRDLIGFLKLLNVKITACVATEYGEDLIDQNGITVRTGRMNLSEMTDFFTDETFDFVIDCTHPYAQIVTENIFTACQTTKTAYKRLNRESSDLSYGKDFETTEKVIHYLLSTSGNILCTLGSKELYKFKNCGFLERLYVRVLPVAFSLQACTEIGLPASHIIAMQGPFSYELNKALITDLNIQTIITKDGGKVGGFSEKVQIAKDLNKELLVIKKPVQKLGSSLEELKNFFKEKYIFTKKPVINLVACGVGSLNLMTKQAENALETADIIIGAKRLTDTLSVYKKPVINEIYSHKIAEHINENSHCKEIAVVLTGDIGFYSGAKKLRDILTDYKVNNICGISSLVYLSAKLGISWEDIKLLSLHGKNDNIISNIKQNEKVFTLLGGENTVHSLCEKLIHYNMNVLISVGENLSYDNEKITTDTAENLLKIEFSSLACAVIFNKNYNNTLEIGLDDADFIRVPKVPMTKSEVRAVSIAKLKLSPSSVVYDVGAGSGSVSIETALHTPNGKVFAIEKNEEAIKAIKQNKIKFMTDNMTIVKAIAPDGLADLPAPTHAFIGGSCGNLKEIVDLILSKNSKTRFVVNAVSLETLMETVAIMNEFTTHEVVNITSARAKKLGSYNLMMANNPIYIITFQN
ncbi:MAG: precorrin-6A reductase [Clostridia bacterium]